MDREIKFRALDGNKWQYGTYYYGVMYPTSFMGHYVNDVQIDEGTLGQFTGLLDKNGKEIYEGDIVKLHVFTQEFGENLGVMEGEKELTGFISFEELGLAFKESEEDEEWFYLVYAPGMLHEESFEIIGNIHQTPELLK